MLRKLTIVCLVVLLAGTVSVLWAGLNFPPPLWILEYGMPGSQHPTGKTITGEGVTFVMISPGYFRMGSDWFAVHPDQDQSGRQASRGDVEGRMSGGLGLAWGKRPEPSDEMPVHWCEFRRRFGIARTEITNVEYERFDPNHERDGWQARDTNPVVNVSWEDARKYCKWLSGKLGRQVRLPSESEWECACRAGTRTEYITGVEYFEFSGEWDPSLDEYAWYGGNWLFGPHPVGRKRPNAWGLLDTLGNVNEWCEDTYHEPYRIPRTTTIVLEGNRLRMTVGSVPDNGSAWVTGSTEFRVIRGGSYESPHGSCRSACRACMHSWVRSRFVGFRASLTLSHP